MKESFLPVILWNDTFLTHIPECDDQHKKLFDIINALHDNIKEDNNKDTLKQILLELVDYTNYHFKTEEDLFDKYNYPNTLVHKNEHKEYTKL